MSPEGPKPSEQIDLKPLLIIGGVFLLSQFAFSKQTRNKIWERDKGICQICGQKGGCECGHITHDKSDPRYDDVSNGRLVCKPDHYLADHVNRAGRNGLTIQQNKGALRLLWLRMTEKEKANLPPPPEEQTW